MQYTKWIIAAAAAIGASSAAQAVTYTLTFDANVACGSVVCSNFTPIDQGYGDTALVDVSYQSVANPGESNWIADVFYWDTGYGDLVGNAWGGLNDSQGAAQIIFTPAAGYKVTLVSLDIAGWLFTDRDSQSSLYDSSYNLIAWTGAFTAPGSGHLPLNCGGAFCTRPGLVLEWGPNAYNAGVDNVVFMVTKVPEPASWALMIGGFGMVGSALRRRRSAIA
jgi:hypothetical protein